MAARAELIFLTGPQQGERTALAGGVLKAGRDPACEVHLREEFVSRRQLHLELTNEGWLVQNLAERPFTVNDRKYKKGKRILLDTGDVLGVGLETRILFVSSGDDAEAALKAWREAHPSESPPAPPVPGAARPAQGGVKGNVPTSARPPAQPPAAQPGRTGAPPPLRAAPGAAKTPPGAKAGSARTPGARPAPAQTPTEEEDQEPKPSDEEVEAQKRRARLKKYSVMFSVYAGIFLVIIIAAVMRSSPKDDGEGNLPPRLDKTQIDDAIKARFTKSVNPVRAAQMREKATALFHARRDEPGKLYKCVKYFKLYLAYTRSRVPADPEEARNFDQATKELIDLVDRKYSDAWIYEQDKNWRKAKQVFEDILKYVPAKEDPEPEPQNAIFDNVVKHLTYVSDNLSKGKKGLR